MPGPYEQEAYTVVIWRDTTTNVVVNEAWYRKELLRSDYQLREEPERFVKRNRSTGKVVKEKFSREDGLKSTQQYGPQMEIPDRPVRRKSAPINKASHD